VVLSVVIMVMVVVVMAGVVALTMVEYLLWSL